MSTQLKSSNIDTTGWNEFPFVSNGVNFVSKISNESPLLSQIKRLPAGIFEEMNKRAVNDLISDTTSLEAIASRLLELNESASHSVLELA